MGKDLGRKTWDLGRGLRATKVLKRLAIGMNNSVIGPSGGYRKMFSFGWTCLIYHATSLFCARNYNFKNDALGKTVGQMIGAARSARQNIVEASSRAATSKEQELRQLDVAKGSLDELAGDYEAFLVDHGEAPWSKNDLRYTIVSALQLDSFSAVDDVDHRFGVYTIAMRRRCSEWLESEDPFVAANAILIAIRRATALLVGQMNRTAEVFLTEGGFTERLSRERLAARDRQAVGTVPICPKCGNPMRKVVARKGRNLGKEFLGCSRYPDCDGVREC